MRVLLLVVAVLSLVAASDDKVTTVGLGLDSCGTWTASRRDQRRLLVGSEQWVLGFLSGIGFVHQDGDDPLEGTDADGVWAWIDNYCRTHPIEKLHQAAKAFYFAHPHP